MDKYKCKLCEQSFKTSQTLEKHMNKLNKCDKVTDFKCTKCNKYFTQNANLKKHTTNNKCKTIDAIILAENTTNIIDDNIKTIMNLNTSIESKIELLIVKHNIKLNKSTIKEILTNKNIADHVKLELLSNTTDVKPATIINNNTTNTTNNILINSFGNENIEYLSNNFYKKLINNHYGENIFLKLSNEIYLNEVHPENQTIKIDNLNNKFCKVKENNKWVTTTKDAALKKIFDKIFDIVSTCLANNEETIPEEKIKIINGYIEKDFEDELIIEAVKKLALNIYNFYNSSI